ncbi:MAG: HisA/HisF-related TIM barrel protein, partial [Planctomycetaceae bacterium]
MQLLPAIDLLGGRCVRLRQGNYEDSTVFSDDPVQVACRWQQEGAERLHLVDLDGAKAGRPVNQEVVRRIVDATGLPCQLGG